MSETKVSTGFQKNKGTLIYYLGPDEGPKTIANEGEGMTMNEPSVVEELEALKAEIRHHNQLYS